MDEGDKFERDPNPRETANWLSTVTFAYTLPIFLKGRKIGFTEEDICKTLARDKSSVLGDNAEKFWEDELRICKENQKVPNVKNIVLKLFKFNLFITGFGIALNDLIFRPGQIIFLGHLVSYYLEDNKSSPPYWQVSGLLLSSLCSVLTLQLAIMEGFHVGMDTRIAICSLIYRKALKLNLSAFSETTVGQMINLLSNDVGVFDRYVALFQLLYIAPAQLILFTILLYFEMGFSSCIGIGVLVLFIPLQDFLGKLSAKYRLKTALRTDSRIRLMDEIIRGIGVIKMYAWEKPFANLVAQYRRLEIKSLKTISYIKGSFLIYFAYISLPLFLTTWFYILFGNLIDAKKIFFATALFNTVAFNMGTVFPQSIALWKECNVASARIGKFLLLDEAHIEKYSTGDASIKLKSVTAKWSKAIENTLSDLTIFIEPGSLVAVIGSVGSGKSSFLQCLLRELSVSTGSILVNGSISYSSQDPWIFNSSIRQNILFGSKMDKRRYKDVINCCALAKDVKMFSAGDKTIVGEQGSSLSGGQKARVNLSRAVYRDADIYLLDDPLSAVDVNVGKQIFNECICGYLKKKTVILVTHQLQYLQHVDRIIVLENGVIKADGTFKQLQSLELSFLKLLKTEGVHLQDESDEYIDKKYESNTQLNAELPKIKQEQRSSGAVSMHTFVDYAKAARNNLLLVLVFILFILVQLLLSGSFWFMSYWVNFEQSFIWNRTHNITQEFDEEELRNYFVYIYTAITVLVLILIIVRNTVSFNFCMRSSTHLHDSMFESVVHATMEFFNTNGAGRILNRFTKDMGVVDELLPLTLLITAQTVFSILGIFITTSIVNPWIIIPSVLIIVLLKYLKDFYLSSSINIKRLEGITKSPVFGHLHSTLQGIITIRGFQVQEILKKEFDDKQDLHSSTYLLFILITRTLAYWLDLLSFLYLTTITLLLVSVNDEIYGGNVGLVITQGLQLLVQLQWGVRQSTDMENYMTSAERVLEYNSIDHERSLVGIKKPNHLWPEFGKIVFKNVFLSYSPDTLVLKNVSFTIKPEEKIGIVGRTGAGKSSIISAIFQLFEIQGNIIIDDIDIKEIDLIDLRKKISIIPQNPVIFAGSIRRNLDPFDECADEVLWTALEEVQMKEAVEALDLGLKMEISEGGSNLSVGQRQLICLARAIIRNNKILILDEATANVDPQTDAVIQQTIRQIFSKCTILTVAHRLETVIDSDKILVLDSGAVVEFDHPQILLNNPNSEFYKMVEQLDSNIRSNIMKTTRENS